MYFAPVSGFLLTLCRLSYTSISCKSFFKSLKNVTIYKMFSCRWSLSHYFSVFDVVLLACKKRMWNLWWQRLLYLFYLQTSKIFKHFNFLNNFPTLSPMCIAANPLKQPSRLWWAGWQPLLPSQQGKLGRESRATGVSKIIMGTKLYNGHNLPPTLIGFHLWLSLIINWWGFVHPRSYMFRRPWIE